MLQLACDADVHGEIRWLAGDRAMPHAVLIVGLCGCGKSHLAQEYATQGYVCLDESFEGRRFAADPGKNLSTDKFNELKKQLA
jgi:hypothetical protein